MEKEHEPETRIVLRGDAIVTCIASLIIGFSLGIAATMAIVSDALVNR